MTKRTHPLTVGRLCLGLALLVIAAAGCAAPQAAAIKESLPDQSNIGDNPALPFRRATPTPVLPVCATPTPLPLGPRSTRTPVPTPPIKPWETPSFFRDPSLKTDDGELGLRTRLFFLGPLARQGSVLAQDAYMTAVVRVLSTAGAPQPCWTPTPIPSVTSSLGPRPSPPNWTPPVLEKDQPGSGGN